MRDNNTLRLRLVVRRHTLPEVRVAFPVQLDSDPTIANLLEQVNAVIPLESDGDWGLEDYAVELRDSNGHGFECLHFQQVSVILKTDEEVLIRPLDTGDRRKRRLSGRDQISTDGKHLVDGVAFGRPLLKAIRGRPAVAIPPLKRRRIAYEADEDEAEGDNEHNEPRFLLAEHGEDHRTDRPKRKRAKFLDFDEESESDEDDAEDDNFVDEDTNWDTDEDGSGRSDLEEELRDLQADNEEIREPVAPEDNQNPNSSPGDRGPASDLETPDTISALRAAFPTAPVETCKRALDLHDGSPESAYLTLRSQHHQPIKSLTAMLTDAKLSASKAAPTDHDEPDDSDAESVTSMVKHYDQHGFPSGSILAGTAAAQMAEALRKSGHPVKAPVHTKFDEDADSRSAEALISSSSSDEEDMPDDNSESASGSDSGPEVTSSKMPDAARHSHIRRPFIMDDEVAETETESESGDESSSSSEAESSDSDDSDGSDDDDDSSRSGASLDLSEGTDDDDDANSNSDGNFNEESDAQASDDSSASSDESDESDSSSDDSSLNSSNNDIAKPQSPPKGTITSVRSSDQQHKPGSVQQPSSGGLGTKTGAVENQQPVPPGQGKSATQKRNARRRAARMAQKAAARAEQSPPVSDLDALLEAGSQDLLASIAAKKATLLQRMNQMQELLFEEAKAAASQSKDGDSTASQAHVSESPVPHTGADGSAHELASSNRAGASSGYRQSGNEPAVEEELESWRDKIVYRAVECCHDGVELSEPPFPFVQRWDPQQQYSAWNKNKRGGRSKRKLRNQEEYLDGGGWANAKRRRYDTDGQDGHGEGADSWAQHDDTTGFEDTVLNYDDEPEEAQEPEKQASSHDFDDEDDLPPIPTDVFALPALGSGEATVGMVLTWKQWVLSSATNWQPQVSSVTGIVVEVPDNNALRVRLAKRDRNLDRNEKIYDDDGNRVYDKFELPAMEDDGEEADEEQGYRTLDLADMIEPRILAPATEALGSSSLDRQPDDPEQERTSATGDAVPHGELESPTGRVSATPDETEAERAGIDTRQANTDTQSGVGQSVISETPLVQEQLVDTSISEDRRDEISRLINDAGFRKDIDPAVTDNASLDLSSPSRQLEEMSHDATFAASEISEAQHHSSPRLPSQTTLNNIDSQPILLEPFHGFSDATSEPRDERRVAYPGLEVPPSDTGSLQSGRQVDPDFSIELGNDSLHNLDDPATVSRSTLGRHSDDQQDLAREKPEEHSDAGSNVGSDAGLDSDASDSSLSLSGLWSSASTHGRKSPNRQTVMSAIQARKPAAVRDLDYEATMRRVDNSDISDDDNENHPSTLVQKLVNKPIEKPTPKKLLAQQKGALKSSSAPDIKTELVSSTPERTDRATSGRTVRATSSAFVVSEGSQVVSLVTSSPEPELEEHYAEDSIDETYEEPSMPAGSGCVKKSRARRGVSVPASSVAREHPPRRLASSQSKQGTDKRTSTVLDSLVRAKKKVLLNMS